MGGHVPSGCGLDRFFLGRVRSQCELDEFLSGPMRSRNGLDQFFGGRVPSCGGLDVFLMRSGVRFADRTEVLRGPWRASSGFDEPPHKNALAKLLASKRPRPKYPFDEEMIVAQNHNTFFNV
jgi:hypothetical protein